MTNYFEMISSIIINVHSTPLLSFQSFLFCNLLINPHIDTHTHTHTHTCTRVRTSPHSSLIKWYNSFVSCVVVLRWPPAPLPHPSIYAFICRKISGWNVCFLELTGALVSILRQNAGVGAIGWCCLVPAPLRGGAGLVLANQLDGVCRLTSSVRSGNVLLDSPIVL